MRANLFLAEIIHVGESISDELERPLVELSEIVGSIEDTGRLVAEPADIFQLGLYKLLLFFERVGVVEAQVAVAVELRRRLEVQPNCLGVANVQKTIGFGRKSCLHPSIETPVVKVIRNRFTNEVLRRRSGFSVAHLYSQGCRTSRPN